jgi:hypothetical protein
LTRAFAILSVALAALLAGCKSTSRKPPFEAFSDMRYQAKYKPQAESAFFADGRASRASVPGTVARGSLKEDDAFYRGIRNGAYVVNPLPVSRLVLERGMERYNIYCAPCHDRAGTGRGIVGLKATWLSQDLTDERMRTAADGELFDTITHGKRTMPGYQHQIGESDRWAIVAYVRALQRAAAGTLADVPAELRDQLR